MICWRKTCRRNFPRSPSSRRQNSAKSGINGSSLSSPAMHKVKAPWDTGWWQACFQRTGQGQMTFWNVKHQKRSSGLQCMKKLLGFEHLCGWNLPPNPPQGTNQGIICEGEVVVEKKISDSQQWPGLLEACSEIPDWRNPSHVLE